MTHLVKSLSSWRCVVTTCHPTRIGHVLQVLFGTAFGNAKTLEDNNKSMAQGARERYLCARCDGAANGRGCQILPFL